MALRLWRLTNSNPEPMLKTSAAPTNHDSPSCAAVLIAQTSGKHRRQRQQHAERIDRARVRVTRFGHQPRRQHQKRQQDRHGDQEYRTPVEVLQQHAAHDRAQRRSGGEARCPDRDGEPSRGGVGEDVAQQRQRRGHQHGAEHAEQSTCRRRGTRRWARTPRRPTRRRSRRRRSTAVGVGRSGHRGCPS